MTENPFTKWKRGQHQREAATQTTPKPVLAQVAQVEPDCYFHAREGVAAEQRYRGAQKSTAHNKEKHVPPVPSVSLPVSVAATVRRWLAAARNNDGTATTFRPLPDMLEHLDDVAAVLRAEGAEVCTSEHMGNVSVTLRMSAGFDRETRS